MHMPDNNGYSESYPTDNPNDWPIHHLTSEETKVSEYDMQLAYHKAGVWLDQAARGEVPHD